MFGFIDEFGTAGVAAYSNDWLVVSLVVFNSKDSVADAERRIGDLRSKLALPLDYEFHCNSNSPRVKVAFYKLLQSLDFSFVSVAIKKIILKKTAQYSNFATKILDFVEEKFPEIFVLEDENHSLYSAFYKEKRTRNLRKLRIKEADSKTSLGLQVADYVVNISAKRAKHENKAEDAYRFIRKKELAFLEYR